MIKESLKRLLIITGTPGAGKSYVAKLLEKELGLLRIDLHELIESDPVLSSEYNKEKDCYDLDMDKVEELVKEILEENPRKVMILDSHVAHHLSVDLVMAAVVIRCSDLKILETRLKERNYSLQKIKENLDVEIFDVCHDEALELGVDILVFDSSCGVNEKEVISKVEELLVERDVF